MTLPTRNSILAFLLLLICSCANSVKTGNKIIEETLSFEKQLEVLDKLGYNPKPQVTNEFLLDFMKYELQIPNPIDSIEKNPYFVLYFALAQQDAKIDNYYLTEKYFWYVLDYFEQPIAYKNFMERMGQISRGEIVFKDVNIEFDKNNIKWITFNVNGLNKKWNLKEGNNVDDSFVQRFYYLTKELGTKGHYTYFDRGGEDFIIDYATEKEQIHFNEITGLNRIWLGEENHFSEPID